MLRKICSFLFLFFLVTSVAYGRSNHQNESNRDQKTNQKKSYINPKRFGPDLRFGFSFLRNQFRDEQNHTELDIESDIIGSSIELGYQVRNVGFYAELMPGYSHVHAHARGVNPTPSVEHDSFQIPIFFNVRGFLPTVKCHAMTLILVIGLLPYEVPKNVQAAIPKAIDARILAPKLGLGADIKLSKRLYVNVEAHYVDAISKAHIKNNFNFRLGFNYKF